MVFCKVRSDVLQVKRNSLERHVGIHKYLRQMEDYNPQVTLELWKEIKKAQKIKECSFTSMPHLSQFCVLKGRIRQGEPK